ncbi:hypothetical protein C5167_010326 [Papaver somniferum]|uniref:Uncharacterized protein n=1 Tax=Papaver somniferum TaxID=3469 RepID=A0A4Y7K2R6_PAPSO|nr:hypothetical protein C5167_010326 [Papaver somniferum]
MDVFIAYGSFSDDSLRVCNGCKIKVDVVYNGLLQMRGEIFGCLDPSLPSSFMKLNLGLRTEGHLDKSTIALGVRL